MDQLFVILVLTNFLKTVGIMVVIYFVLKFVGRLLFPIVVKKAVNNMQARQSQYQRQQKQEGEVTVEKNRRDQSRARNTEGEYVDFEEVD
ncbi:MAG TPA: DUF4834 domain-containing protein [Prolixibacteraceae bacterium]|nr:DUF4834 domain-containing protein [Prolixibacteraceae bacterium]